MYRKYKYVLFTAGKKSRGTRERFSSLGPSIPTSHALLTILTLRNIVEEL